MTTNRNNRRLMWFAAGAVTLVLAGAAVLPATSWAAEQGVAEQTPALPDSPRSDVQAALAEALGVTVEELESAQAEAADAALTLAVEEGYLTQSQADQLRDRFEGGPPNRGRGGRIGVHGFAGMDVEWDALLAEALGISVEDLDAARTQVFDEALAQAVTDGEMTQEQADLTAARRDLMAYLQPRLEAARTQALEDAVREGIVTQEQLDALQEQGWGGRGGLMDGMEGRGGPGGHGGRGGHHGNDGGEFGGRGWNQMPGAPDGQPRDSSQDQSEGNG